MGKIGFPDLQGLFFPCNHFNFLSKMQHILCSDGTVKTRGDIDMSSQSCLGGHTQPAGGIIFITLIGDFTFIKAMPEDKVGLQEPVIIVIIAQVKKQRPPDVIVVTIRKGFIF